MSPTDIHGVEARKKAEREFHNSIRTVTDDDHVADTRWSSELEHTVRNNPLWANMKYYSIERRSRKVVLEWFMDNCAGKNVLDYCCGNGEDGIFIAGNGAERVTGIDISEVSILNCEGQARSAGLSNIKHALMDAESLDFTEGSFDVVTEYGAMHHLSLEKAYAEIARVLKRDGKAIFVEALGHNMAIDLYRKLTPKLRTPWEAEHILKKKDIYLARKFFNKIEVLGFYHLATLGAVPFRNTPLFNGILRALEAIDGILLRLPVIKWQAWQVVYVLSEPRK